MMVSWLLSMAIKRGVGLSTRLGLLALAFTRLCLMSSLMMGLLSCCMAIKRGEKPSWSYLLSVSSVMLALWIRFWAIVVLFCVMARWSREE